MTNVAFLPDRAVISVAGADRVSFLQGLVSADVAAATTGRAVWAALLTPQGKYESDFLLVGDDARILLDVEADEAPGLAAKLARFRLRAKVTIEATGLAVFAGWGGPPPPSLAFGAVAVDTRLPEAGWRWLGPPGEGPEPDALADDYDRHRLLLGIPDGSRDFEKGRSVLLEGPFDEMGGVSWTKGCYMGQELTARTRYRGLLKRRLVPVIAENGRSLPSPGTTLLDALGREAGVMRSSRDGYGLALLRLEHLHAVVESGDGARLRTRIPAWMSLPAREDA